MKSDKKYFLHESSYIDDNVVIGRDTKIWHFSHIQSGAVLGNSCSIGQNVNIGNNVIIGNNVKIQNNVSLYDGIVVSDDVFIGPSAVFTNVIRPRSEYPTNKKYSKTYLEKGVTIGANSTIVCGVTLEEYCFIGSGTVITKNIPNNALVVGNPGRIIGWVGESGEKLEINGTSGKDQKLGTNYEVVVEGDAIIKVKKL